jgi:hypothetical protein
VLEATKIDPSVWRLARDAQGEWFDFLGPTVPRALKLQREILIERLKA